ncbi:MAG: hypothetical protein F4X77_13420 [Acidobacteriia bacterium]|nr:hypothetical protein [Terriglobia bacterium]
MNRLFSRTRPGAEARGALAALPVAALRTAICNQTEGAKAVWEGSTAIETTPASAAADDLRALADEIQPVFEELRNAGA